MNKITIARKQQNTLSAKAAPYVRYGKLDVANMLGKRSEWYADYAYSLEMNKVREERKARWLKRTKVSDIVMCQYCQRSVYGDEARNLGAHFYCFINA